MKITFSTLRLILPAAVALSSVSCGKNKVADANPYQNNPYYGPQSSTYGVGDNSSGSSDYANSTAPAPASNYPSYTDNSYTPPAPAPAASNTYASNSYSGGGSSHVVQKGDTLFSLSRKYGTSVSAIQSANGLNGDLIRTGQTLTIPQG